MRWDFWRKPQEEQGDEMAWDDEEQEGGAQEGRDEGGDEEQEPELDDETRALVEREAEKRVAAAEARYREALKAKGLAFTGDTVAIQEMNQFAAGFGFAGQQQREAAAPEPKREEPEDPFAALGEMPDSYSDPEGFQRWQRARDEIITKRAVEQVTPRIQQMETMFAQTQVDRATDRAKEMLRSKGLGHIAEAANFDQLYGEALMMQPVETWRDPAVLTATFGYILPHLEAPPPPQQQQRPRNEQGQFLPAHEAQRQSLAQMSPSRDAGRPAPAPAGLDPQDQRMAAMLGLTPEEWRHHLEHNEERDYRRFEQQRTRGRR